MFDPHQLVRHIFPDGWAAVRDCEQQVHPGRHQQAETRLGDCRTFAHSSVAHLVIGRFSASAATPLVFNFMENPVDCGLANLTW